jgi:hypothetical protein
VQETWSINETCSIYNACAGRENYNTKPWYERGPRPKPFALIESKGVTTCEWCKRPYRENMNCCPECERFYFGPITPTGYARVFKFQLECEACECQGELVVVQKITT